MPPTDLSLSGKESAQGCIPKRLPGPPDEALGGGNHLSKRKRRLDSLEAAQGAPRDPRRDSRHSSVLAWRIPRTEEPGRLPSTGSHRVGHD